MLRQTLISILDQTFSDFEVIVGNDYPDETLTCELLGISDPRIRFVNHPVNLKEVGNMNALLAMASGRYFSWLADDDLYNPDFLSTSWNLLITNDLPAAVFSSYRIFHGTDTPLLEAITKGAVRELTGREFLNRYFTGQLKIIGVYGLFGTDQLRRIVKGVDELCESGVGLYGEYIFLVRCALFDRIVYIDAPLILSRGHAASWSATNIDLDKYLCAGQELIHRCGDVLRHPSLSDDFDGNLKAICKLHLTTFAGKTVAIEITGEIFGVGAACRSLSRFFEEVRKVRSIFIRESGTEGIHSVWFFACIHLKGFYLIFGEHALKWLRNLLNMKQPKF
jgi:glycosyltransferase involved in cell wall biosynthesis